MFSSEAVRSGRRQQLPGVDRSQAVRLFEAETS